MPLQFHVERNLAKSSPKNVEVIWELTLENFADKLSTEPKKAEKQTATKHFSNARKQDDFGANIELISWLSNFYLLAFVGLSSLWTLFFPSVAKH